MLVHIFRKEPIFKPSVFICHQVVEFFVHTLKFCSHLLLEALFKHLSNLNQVGIFPLRFSIRKHDHSLQQT
jgi:hypothetical protein